MALTPYRFLIINETQPAFVEQSAVWGGGYADLSGKTVCGRDAAVERTGVSSGQRSCERPYRDVGAGPQAQQGLRSAAGIYGAFRNQYPISGTVVRSAEWLPAS